VPLPYFWLSALSVLYQAKAADSAQNILLRSITRSGIYTGVSGAKFNILGGHDIGHSKQKVYMYMCPIPNGFRDRAISLYTSKIVYKKEILPTVSNAGICCSSEKVGSVCLV
jgi:hypothetical protein